MKAVIYFSLSRKQNSKQLAEQFEGDKYQIKPAGKVVKGYFFQIIYYGFKTMRNSEVHFIDPEVDFSKYDELTFVFPIWAGRPSVFIKKYLEQHRFKNKGVRFIGTSDSGNSQYVSSFENLVDTSNNIIEKRVLKKNILN